MKKLLVDVLSESALDELRVMEREEKIKILNEEEVQRMNEKRNQIWKELEDYTYENILKKVKDNV